MIQRSFPVQAYNIVGKFQSIPFLAAAVLPVEQPHNAVAPALRGNLKVLTLEIYSISFKIMNDCHMDWSEEKNRKLKRERGVCFEDVETAIESGKFIANYPHPNQERYPGQRVLIVEIDGYACLVPYIRDSDVLFLKTIYRSRKAQRLFAEGSQRS